MVAEDDAVSGGVLQQLIERHLLIASEFVGLIVIGSRVHDEARSDSDLDVIILFEDFDERIIPGEFIWDANTDSFHSIFDDVQSDRSVQVDAIGRRMTWHDFSTQEWNDALKHDLARGAVVVERGRDVSGLLAERTSYPEDLRIQRLGEAIGRSEYLLEEWRLDRWPDRGGWLAANDQIDAALEELLSALHAFNRVWEPWRYRRLVSTLKLEWLPTSLDAALEALPAARASDRRGLAKRAHLVTRPLTELVDAIDREGVLQAVRAATFTPFTGLGFASNMDEWRRAHSEWRRERGLT